MVDGGKVAILWGFKDNCGLGFFNGVLLKEAGLKVDLADDGPDLPAELVERLDGDPELKAAFEALAPGRQRGYALHFAQPKQSATRASRIEKCAPRILEGKGMHNR